MRNGFLIVGTVALALTASAPFFAAEEELTIKGEVVDTSCYKKLGTQKSTGSAHVACAVDCAKKGEVLGILTDGDGLFKIVGDYADNNNAKLIPYVGKQVEAKGT